MANPDHLDKIRQSVQVWNLWREQNPEIKPDLSEIDLSKFKLRGAVLHEVNFTNANFGGESDLIGANLMGAILIGADLFKAKLVNSHLNRANLSGSNLRQANLTHASLYPANLSGANMRGANLRSATLIEANLSGADLQNANLQEAWLAKAVLTNARLWETQRAGWNIEGVICERVYWDQFAETATEYALGEFESLYSEQTTIELQYPGGISSFEINTLPALLHRLASKHPDTNIRLKTIEATGGGTKVTISLGDADESTKGEVEASASQVLQAQLALRNDDVRRLQFERDFFQRQLDRITDRLLGGAAQQIHFHSQVQNAFLPSGNANVEIHQTFNDNSALIQLIDKLLIRNTEFTAPQNAEVEAAQAELQKPEPQKSRLSSFYEFLKTLPKEAVLKGAGKLGEKAAEADWSSLLHQLGEVIHHLH